MHSLVIVNYKQLFMVVNSHVRVINKNMYSPVSYAIFGIVLTCVIIWCCVIAVVFTRKPKNIQNDLDVEEDAIVQV